MRPPPPEADLSLIDIVRQTELARVSSNSVKDSDVTLEDERQTVSAENLTAGITMQKRTYEVQ